MFILEYPWIFSALSLLIWYTCLACAGINSLDLGEEHAAKRFAVQGEQGEGDENVRLGGSKQGRPRWQLSSIMVDMSKRERESSGGGSIAADDLAEVQSVAAFMRPL